MSDSSRHTPEVPSPTLAPDVVLQGPQTVREVTQLEATFQRISLTGPVGLDLSEVPRLDTAAAWAVVRLEQRVADTGHALTLHGASEAMLALIDTVRAAMPQPVHDPEISLSLTDRVEGLGRFVAAQLRLVLDLVAYLGLFLARLGRALRRPRTFPLTALVHHCEQVGLKAVPIVALMAFLIGVVLAFQGASQLRQFGAEIFVVDLIAISILRELGILLTAIIVAGRTASAFTAAIGSMKMREEIDAMQTLGIDPALSLFVPRILALVLMLPILGLIANLSGLFGGGLMAWLELGISPQLFLTRLVNDTDISHVIVGMIKAPVFALVIGIVGCHAGMQVKSNAESLGAMTSAAVVTAIFSVIVLAALFSVFFTQIGM